MNLFGHRICDHPISHQVALRENSAGKRITAVKCSQCGSVLPYVPFKPKAA